jgi:hypothetical protein
MADFFSCPLMEQTCGMTEQTDLDAHDMSEVLWQEMCADHLIGVVTMVMAGLGLV